MKTIHTIVFQAEAGGGNPCPVTLDADQLTEQQMQEMTAAFGHESAFLMATENPECDFKVRYFLPLHEVQMCIHATVGCTTVLVEQGLATKSPIVFETVLGPVQAFWQRDGGGIEVAVEQFLPQYMERNPTADEVCRALRIEPGDLMSHPIQSVATSRFKLIVPLKTRACVDGLKPDFPYLWDLCDQYDTTGFYVYAMEETDGDRRFYARQFPKRAGYDEDPATGVAASALGGYLVHNQIVPTVEGWNQFTIMQGFAMGRPSIIHSDSLVTEGEITRTRVRGSAYLVEKGV